MALNRRERRTRLDEIASVSKALQSDLPEVPDLTGRILSRVHDERPFLDRRARRWVIGSRIMACGMVVFAGLFVAAVNRWAPDALLVTEPHRPVSAVVTGLTRSTSQIAGMPQAFESLIAVTPPGSNASTSVDGRGIRGMAVVNFGDLSESQGIPSASGEPTARCFVGPMCKSDSSMTLDSSKGLGVRSVRSPAASGPPISLARASLPEIPLRSQSLSSSQSAWFAPVHLCQMRANAIRASTSSGTSGGFETMPASPVVIDLIAPR